MHNNIIQSLWVGSTSLSPMELLCINSYLHHGHEFHLYVYDDIENLPPGAIRKDAREILPAYCIFRDEDGTWGPFSDYFRFTMLYKKGGWWVDMDSICMQHFNIEDEYCFSTELNMHGVVTLNVGNIKSPAGAEFLRDCIEYIEERGFRNIYWGEISLILLRKVLDCYDSELYIQPPVIFCPLHTTELDLITSGQPFDIPKESLAMHLWNELWRRNKMDKRATYPPSSLYEKLKAKYNRPVPTFFAPAL